MMRRVVIVLITVLATCLWLGGAGGQWGGHTQKRVTPPSQRETPQYPKKTQKQGTYSPSQRETPKATSSTPKITKKEFSQNYKYTRTPEPITLPKVPKGWEGLEQLLTAPPWLRTPGWANLPGSVKEASLKNVPYTYIPVRVTVTDNVFQKSPYYFFEFQGSAVAKGWLQINNDLTGFHLMATAPKGRLGNYLNPVPIGPSFKITKLNGWLKDPRSPRSGYRNKRRIKFDRSKLNGSLVVDLRYPSYLSHVTTKTNLALSFPRPMMVSPPEGGGPPTPPLGPFGMPSKLDDPSFIVTPAMMKKFVDQGYFSKTFSLQPKIFPLQEAGGYTIQEDISIKIEFLKMGKPTVVAMPTAVTKKKEDDKDEEEKWEVFLTGYEIDEMNPYWKITTRVRGAVRFDWKLRGKFTIVNKKGVRTYAGGVITIADVGLSSLYEPISVWLTKPFKCRGCQDVKSLTGKFLKGILEGNAVKFYWGSKKPYVNVEAKIVVPCKPMPDCARWKERRFDSEEFLSRVNYVSIPLVDGATVPGKVVSTKGGLRWVNYRYLLRRLK